METFNFYGNKLQIPKNHLFPPLSEKDQIYFQELGKQITTLKPSLEECLLEINMHSESFDFFNRREVVFNFDDPRFKNRLKVFIDRLIHQ